MHTAGWHDIRSEILMGSIMSKLHCKQNIDVGYMVSGWRLNEVLKLLISCSPEVQPSPS